MLCICLISRNFEECGRDCEQPKIEKKIYNKMTPFTDSIDVKSYYNYIVNLHEPSTEMSVSNLTQTTSYNFGRQLPSRMINVF